MILLNLCRCRSAPFVGALVACCFVTTPLSPIAYAEESAEVNEESTSFQLESFDMVWETVQRSYHDPDFGGVDWQQMRENYRPQAAEAEDAETLRPILNAMLMELGVSHFGVFPPHDELTDLDFLSDDDDDSEEEDSETTDENEEASDEDASEDDEAAEDEAAEDEVDSPEDDADSGSYTGIHLRLDRDEVLISSVDVGSPAMEAGLRAGYVLRKIGDANVSDIYEKLRKQAEEKVDYLLVSFLQEFIGMPEDDTQTVEVEVDWGKIEEFEIRPRAYSGRMSQSVMNLPEIPLHYKTHAIPVIEGEVLYMHFNMFLPELMPEIRKALRNSADYQGIIIDLRGNLGGIGAMANGIAGLLVDEKTELGTMEMRAGRIPFIANPQSRAFLGPLVILVDELSASTSEILAGGLQEAGRATIIGRTTMGAALPSYIVNLPNGDLFQHAVADFTTPEGARLEGDGVTPDIEVPLDRRKLTKGRDVPIEKALQWIHRNSRAN